MQTRTPAQLKYPLAELTEQEVKLLNILRDLPYGKVAVHMENGVMKRAEVLKSIIL